MTHLLSRGQIVFTDEQAQHALQISKGALLDATQKQQRRNHLITPRRGFYVIVPPQFLSMGAPPPSWYIDALMAQEQRPYYVGLLKAAELHGATHQAAMEFQVITDKRMPRIKAGRSAIAFYYRKDMGAISGGLEDYGEGEGVVFWQGRIGAGGRDLMFQHPYFRAISRRAMPPFSEITAMEKVGWEPVRRTAYSSVRRAPPP
jgi:hypothetical protein